MADLNDLKLSDEPIADVDYATMPTGIGSVIIPPQPGIYEFELPPSAVIFNCFALDDSDPKQGQRISAVLRDAAALKNVSLGNLYNAQFSNRTRVINFKSGAVTVSDLAMLLKAVDANLEGANNAAYAQALVNSGGSHFLAENKLTAACNPKRDIYKDSKQVAGQKGCGKKWSSDPYTPKTGPAVIALPKDEGGFVTRLTCDVCGAEIRAFGNLQGFRHV